jgi:hypothetical protein
MDRKCSTRNEECSRQICPVGVELLLTIFDRAGDTARALLARQDPAVAVGKHSGELKEAQEAYRGARERLETHILSCAMCRCIDPF